LLKKWELDNNYGLAVLGPDIDLPMVGLHKAINDVQASAYYFTLIQT
jgi:hypothetical protein